MSDVNVVGTAVELTTAAKMTEMAGSVGSLTPTFTPSPTPTFTATATLTSTLAPTQCTPSTTATVTANVRSGPGTAYDIVGALLLGASAPVAGRNDANTWWYIDYPGISGGHGWIAGSVVTTACLPPDVQVVAAPSLPPTKAPTLVPLLPIKFPTLVPLGPTKIPTLVPLLPIKIPTVVPLLPIKFPTLAQP